MPIHLFQRTLSIGLISEDVDPCLLRSCDECCESACIRRGDKQFFGTGEAFGTVEFRWRGKLDGVANSKLVFSPNDIVA